MGIRQLVKLSAYLLSDGGISPHGKDSYTVYFRNKDSKLIESFQSHIGKCINKRGYEIKRKDGTTFVKLYSRELAQMLFKMSKSYRTKPCNVHPVCMHSKGKRSPHIGNPIKINGTLYPPAELPLKYLLKNKNLARDFLRIYISCDGGVSVVPARNKRGSLFLVRKVFIEVNHPILRKQLNELLRHFGFNPVCYGTQIRLTRRDDLEKFHKDIGFIEGSKISNDSKYLAGNEKNIILKKIIDSYDNPRTLLDFLLKTRSSFRA